MQRIGIYPTHIFNGYYLRIGKPYPFGATFVPGGINFSIFSRHANYCKLVLLDKNTKKILIEIPFRGLFTDVNTNEDTWTDFSIGNVFCIIVFNLDFENIEYAYRLDGPYQKAQVGRPAIHRFDPQNLLIDPYSKGLGGRYEWQPQVYNSQYRTQFVNDDFDWGNDKSPELRIEDLIIYEMHVRGFTKHSTSGVKVPGTYSAIAEKIPYFKDLGINCIELMPIFEFDESDNNNTNPITGERLANYWGYNPVNFFSPKASYAANSSLEDATLIADEFKNLIKKLHANGIEVILDVVFNHTAEGNEFGQTISFRGIDNATYYLLDPTGKYFNFSGTGNTLNCNNPIVRNLILDCLRFWVSEYHIDGFRFDLAAILGRDQDGNAMNNPPLLEALAYDPVLGKCKLIAEAWDAGGLYQVGSFPGYQRWVEWNGIYRDILRQFLRSDYSMLPFLHEIFPNSPLAPQSGPSNKTVNFITCHDGFTLRDLFSYNEKHNQENGENNIDGSDINYSCNYGFEGDTDNAAINEIRERQSKNAIAILMTSQGTPMIMMGDEIGRTQNGNNNPYCQDNEMNWLDWSLLKMNSGLFNFIKQCIRLRNAYPILKYGISTIQNKDDSETITWHGTSPWNVDWSPSCRTIAIMFQSYFHKTDDDENNKYYIYIAINMDITPKEFYLPVLSKPYQWHVFANTEAQPPFDVYELGKEPLLEHQDSVVLKDHTVVILIGK